MSPGVAIYIQSEATAELEGHEPEDLELAMNLLEQLIGGRDQGEALPGCLPEMCDVFEVES